MKVFDIFNHWMFNPVIGGGITHKIAGNMGTTRAEFSPIVNPNLKLKCAPDIVTAASSSVIPASRRKGFISRVMIMR